MSAVYYLCSYGHASPVDNISQADWPTHVTIYHNAPAERAAATATRTVGTAPATGSTTQMAIASAVGLLERLAIKPEALKRAAPTNAGTVGQMRPGDVLYMMNIVMNQLHGGKEFDRGIFLVTLCEHLWETDGGEETFPTGAYALIDVNGASTVVTWDQTWKAVYDTFDKELSVAPTPRQLFRGVAKIAFDMIMGDGPLNHLRETPPSWAQRFTASGAWWAYCSVFAAMKAPDRWTAEEKAAVQAHNASVTKRGSNRGDEAIHKFIVAPDEAETKTLQRSGIARMAQNAIANGNVEMLYELNRMLAP